MSCAVLVYGVAKGRGPIPAPTSVCRAPHIEIKKRPSGAFSPFLRRGAPKLQSSAERTPQRPSGSSHASGRGGWVPKPYGGVTTPKALFFGAPPHFFGQDQRNGVDSQHQPKVQQDKSASSSQPKPTPGRGWNPAPTRGSDERGGVGGGRREGSSRTPTPTGPCGTGRVLRFCGARVTARGIVKAPPVRAAFSTFHLKYTNPEPLFSGYPSVQASAPQSGQVFPAARSSSM